MSTAIKQTVKVVTDSTADMKSETLQRLDVTMVPLMVLMGDQTYRDGMDITSFEFYQRLPQLSKLPTTSQPSPGNFMKVFEDALADGSSVISLHLSSKLSGTYQNALVASQNFEPGRVRVFDTQMVSAGTAMFVNTAVEMARAGKAVGEIEAEMHDLRNRMKLIAVVDTLEYLHKGGRIGGLRSFMGSLLNVKPILQLKDGEVQPLAQVRTRAKALQRVADIIKDMGKIERMAIMHAVDPDGAGELANLLAPVFPLKDMYISDIGPVIGAHTGPRTIGIVVELAKKQ